MATTDRGRGYPVSVSRRQVDVEPRPEGGGVAVFDEDAAAEINRARLDHLESLGLPLAGRSVLDVGGGVGHLA
jgi:2-polyprenyl-3-methyl-5-hydroxy-6-metoxy-1,4-benzoquinol methylase